MTTCGPVSWRMSWEFPLEPSLRWVLERKAPNVVRVGRLVFFRREAVDAWLRKNESTDIERSA